MATLVVLASYSAYVVGDAVATYTTIHDQADADSFNTNEGWVGQAFYNLGAGNRYQINRNGYIFDTSALGIEASITSVTLDLYGETWDVAGNSAVFDITVVDGVDFQNPVVVGDYGQLLDEVTSLGTLSSALWVLTGYNSISLNAAGIALINKTGNTKLAVRSSRDISSTAPTATNPWYEYVNIWCHTDVGMEPRLTITYTTGDTHSAAIITMSDGLKLSRRNMTVKLGQTTIETVKGCQRDVETKTSQREIDTNLSQRIVTVKQK